MKQKRRWIAGVLSLAMACSLWTTGLPAASAEASGDNTQQTQQLTGSIGLTIRFDLPQTVEGAAGRSLQLNVSRGDDRTVVTLPDGVVKETENSLGAEVSVTVKNADGVELTTESRVGSYQVELSNLPAGGAEYNLELTGTGYTPFRTTVTLDGYSKHVMVGTGDGTFSLGDLDQNGIVSAGDLTVMDGLLGQEAGDSQLAAGDLNGDGRLDITDLAYINYIRDVTGEARVLDTAAIVAPEVDTQKLVITEGEAEDLFRAGEAVTLAPAGEAEALVLPIELPEPVEMSEIRITSPAGVTGAVRAGTVQVELENGYVQTIPFGTDIPNGVYAIGRDAETDTVTVNLGNKVPVKKVIITVTEVEGQDGEPEYATVTQIEFLKDIVPENPQNDADQVKGVAATPGDGQVTLEWNAVRNVTGYSVIYGTSASQMTQIASTNTNRVVISGLENLTTYFFQVTATNGDWSGTPSTVVSAMPEPASIPGAPSNISVKEYDSSLGVSWGKTKDAMFYQVFYREEGASDFIQFGGDLTVTSATITGLTNDVTYEVAVKAGNNKGVGPYSAIASGTPNKESLEMPDLPTDGRLDNSIVESVVMANPNNVNRTLCPNFTTADVIDNDASTFWVARAWWESSQFTYTFQEPQDMNYAILVPYLGGNYKYALKNYVVTAKDSNGEVLVSGTYTAKNMDPNKNYLVLAFPMLEGVKELSISLNEREGNGCRVSISEMAFYRSDSLAGDIAGLFTDGTFTQLKPSVTAETISALSERLSAKADFYLDLARLQDELALASELLAGNESALGLVKSDFQSRASSKDSAYGQSASDLQPLGVSARAGATVSIYAVLPDDAPVYVTPTQYYGESGIWRGTSVRLENGRNYIYVPKIGSLTDERGGPLYLTYSGAHPEDIKVQVRVDRNSFITPVLELSGWYDMTDTARRDVIRAYVTQLQAYVTAINTTNPGLDIRNVTEISTPSVLLSIPATQALNGLHGVNATEEEMVETMYQDVLAWEEELFVANKVQGIIPVDATQADYRYPMSTRQNIRYMRMFAGAFMYAAGNHVGVGYGSTAGLMSGKPSSVTGAGKANGLFGWGIAHEIGHNMDKLGKAEITNNIYSLAIQAWDGGSMELNTRLTNSNIWAPIYAKTSAGRPGTASSVFVQLGMYWQLHLAYDQADAPLAFYNQFFKSWKAGEYSGYTYDERVALIAAKTVNRNLTQFFTRWGMTLSEEVQELLSAYPAETRAIWYLNDKAYTYRLNQGEAFDGTVTVTAAMEENLATLTITGGDETILGYEVLKNGTPVGFTTSGTYTDDLGAANNLTYTYSVIPVDYLGNQGAKATANEVRVAYDKTIAADLYTVSREGGETLVTMKNGSVSVTGLKVTGGDLASCSVSVKYSADAADWTPVALGAVEDGKAYFTKPGAAAGDSRIWTYDAAVLRITGLDESASVELLDYPGDRIDFYEGAFVGLMKDDYRYGDGEDDVVPAGTLVIMGLYRGDPVYNTLEIQARYNTTPEAEEANAGTTSIERAMNGYALLFAEIPADGAVSDTSDGFWLFVPDLEAEQALNEQDGVTSKDPMEIRAVFYRTDDPESSDSRRVTSETLWTSFPESDTLPPIVLTGEGGQ